MFDRYMCWTESFNVVQRVPKQRDMSTNSSIDGLVVSIILPGLFVVYSRPNISPLARDSWGDWNGSRLTLRGEIQVAVGRSASIAHNTVCQETQVDRGKRMESGAKARSISNDSFETTTKFCEAWAFITLRIEGLDNEPRIARWWKSERRR